MTFTSLLENKALLIPLIVVIALAVLIPAFLVIRHFYNIKHFTDAYYKKIYRIAMMNDYYLINRFRFNVDDSSQTKIDHILFGDKFIYIIESKLYKGDISGKGDDKSLVFVARNGKTYYTANPLLESKSIVTSLSMISGVEPEFFIGLTLVNDDCNVGVESSSKQFYIIQKSKLESLIKALESRPLSKLNEKKLQEAVMTIDKLNERKNEK